jgi:hypothetical protein
MAEVSLPITLYASVVSITPYAQWTESDGGLDPFLNYDYQWSVIISVQPQLTGDYSVPDSQYNEKFVREGDWLVMTSNTYVSAVQIVSIDPDNTGNGILTCIVEDVDRYNIYISGNYGINDPSPQGPPPVYDALIVRLGEDGLPIMTGVSPYSVPVTTQAEIDSRFRFRNYLQNNYRVPQPGHTFAVGDQISLNANGTYSLASAVGTSAYRVIGRVKDIHVPGNDWFTYEPKGKLVRYITPNLPGSPGGIVYLDPNNPGHLTASKPNSGIAIPLFIKINNTTGVKLDEVLQGGLDNFTATRDPAVSDDSSLGYSYGSLWINTANKKSYINVDPSIGTSVWQLIGSATATVATTTSLGSVQIGDNINVTAQGVISVTKGAGINKVIDIPDVYSRDIADGSLLSYDETRSRWVTTQAVDINIDGGEF